MKKFKWIKSYDSMPGCDDVKFYLLKMIKRTNLKEEFKCGGINKESPHHKCFCNVYFYFYLLKSGEELNTHEMGNIENIESGSTYVSCIARQDELKQQDEKKVIHIINQSDAHYPSRSKDMVNNTIIRLSDIEEWMLLDSGEFDFEERY